MPPKITLCITKQRGVIVIHMLTHPPNSKSRIIMVNVGAKVKAKGQRQTSLTTPDLNLTPQSHWQTFHQHCLVITGLYQMTVEMSLITFPIRVLATQSFTDLSLESREPSNQEATEVASRVRRNPVATTVIPNFTRCRQSPAITFLSSFCTPT